MRQRTYPRLNETLIRNVDEPQELAAALFHATLNLTFMLFPVNGSHFDMRLGGLVMAFAAAIVTVAWGPKTLAGYNGA